MRLLAFDISSTNIGWVSAIDDQPVCWGLITLHGEIHTRLNMAAGELAQLRRRIQPDQLVIEAPIKGPGKLALIQQQRMAGVVMACCATGMPVIEVYPNTAKKALTGTGSADKPLMMRYAESVLGAEVGEHEADALGVLLAGWSVIQQEAFRPKKQQRKKAA